MVTDNQLSCATFDPKTGVVTIFGSRGVQYGNENRWAITMPGGGTFVEVNKEGEAILEIIRTEFIGRAVANNVIDRVAMIVTTPRRAVVLWLEGAYSIRQLELATETEDFIDIPITIDDRELTLRVRSDENGMTFIADDSGLALL